MPRAGFETEMSISGLTASYLRAEAIDERNRVIGSTGLVNVKSGKMTSMEAASTMEYDDKDETSGEINSSKSSSGHQPDYLK